MRAERSVSNMGLHTRSLVVCVLNVGHAPYMRLLYSVAHSIRESSLHSSTDRKYIGLDKAAISRQNVLAEMLI